MIDEKSATKSTIKVVIYGKEYSIISNEDPDYVAKVARYVDSKMMEVNRSGASSNPTQAAVLASMNITDEYFDDQKKFEELLSTVNERCKKLVERISSVIQPD
ncbi:cell division protein ZapA [bacterium]|nr:cell division protein ZapA [bacterium]